MAHLIPVIRSNMGNTEYFQATMTAQDLVNIVRPANELDDWAEKGIEERMQREINERRVANEIVPYLVNQEDRFFGSFVAVVLEADLFTFEGLGDLSVKVPAAYRGLGAKMGFLTIEGGSIVALDGQHRLRAYRDVITGVARRNEGDFSQSVPSDEVSVIIIKHENSEKTRRIFNKINRHAKPTSRSDNLITSEDDAAAIVARRLMDVGGPLSQRDSKGDNIVNWKSNTIAPRSTKLTTLGSIYKSALLILEHHGYKSDAQERPTPSDLDEMQEIVTDWWYKLISTVTGFQEALDDVSSIPLLRGMEQRDNNNDITQTEGKYSLLFRPVGLEALVEGVLIAISKSENDLSLETALYRANQIDWQISAPEWGGTIVQHDQNSNDKKRIQAGKAAVELASQLVAYRIGSEYFDAASINNFKEKYLVARGTPAEDIEYENLESHFATIAEEEAEEIPI